MHARRSSSRDGALGGERLRAAVLDRSPGRTGPARDAAEALAASGLDSNDGELLPLLLIRHGRGRLGLALGEAEAGLRDMRAAARQLEAGAFPPQLWPWRSSHALAPRGCGRDGGGVPARRPGASTDARVRGSRLARNLAPHVGWSSLEPPTWTCFARRSPCSPARAQRWSTHGPWSSSERPCGGRGIG